MDSYDISNQIFIRDFYLNDCDEEFIGEDELFQKEKDVYLNETGECVQELLKDLASSPQWYQLAEYYSALRYIMGLVGNTKSDEQNRSIGEEMLLSIAAIGNPYAIAYISVATKNNNNCKKK